MKKYTTKSSAKRGMWRLYDREHRVESGNPLVGENGTVLQFITSSGHTATLMVVSSEESWAVIAHNC